MKASRLSSILFGAVMLCVMPTFAGNTIKKSLEIHEKVSVQGTELQPGTYRFEWTGIGSDVQVTILHNNEKLATVPAHIVQEKSSNGETGYSLKPGSNGEKDLAEVFFSGGKYDLQLQPGSNNNSQSGSPSSR
jgi:hypothetical protein